MERLSLKTNEKGWGWGGWGRREHTTRNEDVEKKVIWHVAGIEHKV